MMNELLIELSSEFKRGCGFRSTGPDGVGLYLMGGVLEEVCPRLPFPLTICPCCGAGIKFSRGWTWVDPLKLFNQGILPHPDFEMPHYDRCPMCRPEHAEPKAGLMWVGQRHYSPHSFIKEAAGRGVSKKISTVPKGLMVGKTFVYLAHKFCVPDLDDPEEPAKPGVFCVFRVKKVDIVVDTEDPEELPARAVAIKERLGNDARLVKVIPIKDEQEQML